MSQWKISYGSTVIGQTSIPGTGPDVGGMLQRKADARLQPRKPQQACDIGLFSDDAAQLDLVEMFQQPTNGE
jgi:hypothetical protein